MTRRRSWRSRGLHAASAWLVRASYLRRWIVLGAIIGAVAGIGAIVFTTALELATRFFLGWIGGYTPPSPLGEGLTIGSGAQFTRGWAIPLVVAFGGLLSGILVFGIAPEAEGHGTDAAISAVHHNPRGIRTRVALVKIVASAITIGSGGSAGREGPTAQISAGFGSMLSRWLDLTPTEARIAVTVGIGSGIGAIFRAPLGGAILGTEILFRDDFETDALIPSIVASIVGFAIFASVEGFSPIFGVLRGYRFRHPGELVYFAALGVAAGVLGRLYARWFYGITDLFGRIRLPRMIQPAIGGLLVGLMALAIPQVLGTGYGWVQVAMGPGLMTLPLWIVLALPFAKILATSLSIGSGGSGGIFGPGMVIGGFLGAGAWRLLSGMPGVPHSPAPFVIVGMIACFGSVAHAPIAVMLMVAEMTGSLELLAPAMFAVGLATLLVGDTTIYRSQIKDRTASPAHRIRFGLPLLASLPIEHAMRAPSVRLTPEMLAGDTLALLRRANLDEAPVCEADGTYVGSVGVADLEKEAEGSDKRIVISSSGAVPLDSTLEGAMDALVTNEATWLPVLAPDHTLAGVVATGDLIAAYRRALDESLRRLSSSFRDSVLVDVEVGANSALIGRAAAPGLPPGTVVVAIQREEQMILPSADPVFQIGDIVTVLTPVARGSEVRRSIEGSTSNTSQADVDPPMV